jgi:hypothetical protein
MSGEDAPRPYLENLIVLEIKTNKQTVTSWGTASVIVVGDSVGDTVGLVEGDVVGDVVGEANHAR